MAHDEYELSSSIDHQLTLDVHEDGSLWLYHERLGGVAAYAERVDAIELKPQVIAQLLRLLPNHVTAIDLLSALSHEPPVSRNMTRSFYYGMS